MKNKIHETAIIHENVKMGINNTIGPFCVIKGNTIIGDNNTFESHCSIGSEPEHKDYFGKNNKGLNIGDNNIIREYVTINSGCKRKTIINNNIVLLRGSHVGHDSIILDDCTISCNVLIGGHSFISNNVNMGLGAICHQYTKIAPYSMIGMGSVITKSTIPHPFGVYVGVPSKYIKENNYLKDKLSQEEIDEVIKKWNDGKYI